MSFGGAEPILGKRSKKFQILISPASPEVRVWPHLHRFCPQDISMKD